MNQPWPKVPRVRLLSHQTGIFYFFSVSQGICCMRFSDTHSIHIFCLDFFSFKYFFVGVFCFLLCLSVFLFEIHILALWIVQTKKIENFSSEMTAEKLSKHQLWYASEIYIHVKEILLFERSLLISICKWSLSRSSFYSYAIPVP